MSDISIPGITESKYKTDKIVAGLVKVKEIQLDRMQDDRDNFELKRRIWQSINILANKLENTARTLYNIDSPFRQKFSTSSNESVLTISNNRQAENGEYNVKVLQVAQVDSLRSNEINNEYQVSEGNYTFSSGDDTKSFEFNGGDLKKFITVANRHLRNIAQFNIINSRAQNQVLVFRAHKSGSENRLQFEDQAKKLATDIGLILDTSSLRIDLLQESLISPFNKLSDYKFSESKNEVNIGPGQEIRISLPNNYTVRSGSVMRYEILAPKDEPKDEPDNLPPISDTPDNSNPEKEAPKLPKGFEVKNRSRFNNRSASEIPTPPSAELDEIRIDSIGSDTAFTGIDPGLENEPNESQTDPLKNDSVPEATPKSNSEQKKDNTNQQNDLDILNPTTNFYFIQQGRRIAAGPKEGEVQVSTNPHEEILSLNEIPQLNNINEVIIRNPNPDRKIAIRNLRFEDIQTQSDYVAAHPISTAQDAKISYLGVETTRPNNNVSDLLPGLTLNLKKASPKEDILIRTEPDYDAIIQKVAEFVTSYNELMTQLNVVSTNDDTVIQEKISFTEKQEEEAREVLGILRGDSSVNNLRYRLTNTIADGYPTEIGTRVLSDAGISTNLSGFGSGIVQSKLRGYLEFDTEIFRQAMIDKFGMIKDLFARDNNGDFIMDSGSALAIQNISKNYTQPNGPIPYRVKDLDRSIEDSDRRIADYKDYLKDYESNLKRQYGRMEGALNQLEQQQQALENFSNSLNR